MEITEVRDGDAGAFVVVRDDRRLAEMTWRDKDDVTVIDHTWVSPELRGQGVALRLLEAAVARSRSTGRKVVPVCPYVRRAMREHPELRDVLWTP